MPSLRDRLRAPQGAHIMARGSTPRPTPGPTPGHPAIARGHVGASGGSIPPYPPALRDRAAALVPALLDAQRAVLVAAATPDLLALPAPYVPASPEEEHVAATLAQPWVGLLEVEPAGYLRAYRPTPLGRLVVRAYLLERVAGVRAGEGAYVGL